MPAILIVDDEGDYRDELSASFTRAGYSVYTAASAEQAIEVAANTQPEVLIVDWLLRNSADGLSLASAIRLFLPSLTVIAITGFGSSDLRAEASLKEIFGYLEKPFSLGVIHERVREALQQKNSQSSESRDPVGVVLADVKGNVKFCNAYFQELIGIKPGLLQKIGIEDILSSRGAKTLKNTDGTWVSTLRESKEHPRLLVRSRKFDSWESRLYVVLDESDAEFRSNSLVRILLNDQSTDSTLAPAIHFLLLDPKVLSRRLLTEGLRESGLICHTATSLEESLRLIEKDQMVSVVIVDGGMPEEEISKGVECIETTRPDIKLIGTSHADQREYFERCGVKRFLQKPWRWEDLETVLGL